jgi:hypothetical protein
MPPPAMALKGELAVARDKFATVHSSTRTAVGRAREFKPRELGQCRDRGGAGMDSGWISRSESGARRTVCVDGL